jgi:ATP-dependent helicase/nuclease subunit A
VSDLLDRDREARVAAQRVFDRPLVLEAGAGTGKTLTLVARILAWCLGPGWERAAERRASGPVAAGAAGEPLGAEREDERIAASALGRVVAITFTEAAAAELATRTAAELGKLAAGTVPVWMSPDALPDPAVFHRRARALLATLDHLVVRTVHAFCLRLLGVYPLEAGVAPALEVDANGELRLAVVRQTVEMSLRASYGDPGNPDCLELAAAGYGPPEIETALVELLQAGLPAAALGADPLGPAESRDFLGRLSAGMGELLDLLAGRVPPSSPNAARIKKGLETFRERIASGSGLQELRDLLDLSFPDNLRNHLWGWAKSKFNKGETASFSPVVAALVAAAGETASRLDTLAALDLEMLRRTYRVLGPLALAVESELRRRGIAPFDELLRATEELLAGHPEVRSQVRAGIDQLLVDEFQDTDRVQCDILRWIALDGAMTKRPGLFLVGDPKQSIYGWRNADLASYQGFLAAVREAGGEILPLAVNFRSVPAVLDEVQRAIEPVMLPSAGLQPRFEPLLPCAERAGQPGFARPPRAPVEYWVSWTERGGSAGTATTLLEAEAIARDVRALHDREGVPWKEVALLLRGMTDLDLYLEALRRWEVPFAVGRDKQYYRRREIIDAAALVRAILDPGDQLALLTTLRSPVVGVPDAALIPLWHLHFPARMMELLGPDPARLDHLAGVVHAAAAELPADIPGLDRIAGWELSLIAAVENFAALREVFAKEPADVFLDRVRELFLLEPIAAARYLGRYRVANLERFFRQVLSAFEQGDTTAVLRALRTGVAASQDAEEQRPEEGFGDAVAVLTIHGAKGLEFDHVYLPQLSKLPKGDDASETAAGRLPDGRWEYRVFKVRTLGFDRIERTNALVGAAERVRLLYVALTRARERVVMCGAWRPGHGETIEPERAKSSLDLLLARPHRPELGALWDEAAAGGESSAVDATGALWRLLAFAVETPRSHLVAVETDSDDPDPDPPFLDPAPFRPAAERRMTRVFSGAASAEAHGLLDEEHEIATAQLIRPRRDGRDVALAAGIAVHRALEAWDLTADPEAETARQRGLLSAYLEDARAPRMDARRERGRERADSLLRHFAEGPLLGRLRDLADAVVARELPVLLAGTPEASRGPVGFVSGTIDLVYRDAAEDRLVIADFKTDDVTADQDLASREQIYARQGELYVRALTTALGLAIAPRFELWFLRAGVVRAVVLDRGVSSPG